MELFQIKIEIPVQAVEAMDELLLERGDTEWSVLEDVPSRRAWLAGIFGDEAAAGASWAALREVMPCAPLGEADQRALAESDWRDSYKAHFKAWRFGRLHWVPVWERETYAVPADDAVLWLDPGLAFGTGNHETTRLCVERLVALADAQGTAGRVIDAGCGSGILALSAAKLGYRAVVGFDNDPEAVRVSEENAALNGLAGRARFVTGDLVTGFEGLQGDVVMANILANVLVQYARELIAAVAPGGTLVLSGILAVECDGVRKEFAAVAPNWAQKSRTLGEWSDVMLRRPAV